MREQHIPGRGAGGRSGPTSRQTVTRSTRSYAHPAQCSTARSGPFHPTASRNGTSVVEPQPLDVHPHGFGRAAQHGADIAHRGAGGARGEAARQVAGQTGRPRRRQQEREGGLGDRVAVGLGDREEDRRRQARLRGGVEVVLQEDLGDPAVQQRRGVGPGRAEAVEPRPGPSPSLAAGWVARRKSRSSAGSPSSRRMHCWSSSVGAGSANRHSRATRGIGAKRRVRSARFSPVDGRVPRRREGGTERGPVVRQRRGQPRSRSISSSSASQSCGQRRQAVGPFHRADRRRANQIGQGREPLGVDGRGEPGRGEERGRPRAAPPPPRGSGA